MPNQRRVIVDTDTAGDDTQAIMMAALAERISLEGVTIVVGNVDFEYQVENAKYTLAVAGVEDDVSVYEGVSSPLMKEYKTADYVHGEYGLGKDLKPDTGIPSADEHAVDYIVRMARENPGEITLVCIGPLTNVALALQREPDLNELLDDVWFMGGNANDIGNVTPASSYNIWVDPDAAKIAIDALEMTTVGVEVCYTRRLDSTLDEDDLGRIEEAAADSPYAEFYLHLVPTNKEWAQTMYNFDGTTNPDTLTMATLLDPSVILESGRYYMEIDEREGLTRGYSLVDEYGVLDEEPNTRVIKKADHQHFKQIFLDMLIHGDPERSLSE